MESASLSSMNKQGYANHGNGANRTNSMQFLHDQVDDEASVPIIRAQGSSDGLIKGNEYYVNNNEDDDEEEEEEADEDDDEEEDTDSDTRSPGADDTSNKNNSDEDISQGLTTTNSNKSNKKNGSNRDSSNNHAAGNISNNSSSSNNNNNTYHHTNDTSSSNQDHLFGKGNININDGYDVRGKRYRDVSEEDEHSESDINILTKSKRSYTGNYSIKSDVSTSSSSKSGVPKFLHNTYHFLTNEKGNEDIIRWNPEGNGIQIVNESQLAEVILPKYFKHNSFPSFARQLYNYGFRKIKASSTNPYDTFYHEHFQRSYPESLALIKRKRETAPTMSTSITLPYSLADDTRHIPASVPSMITNQPNTAKQSSPSIAEFNPINELLRLQDLKDRGTINDSEFEIIKHSIMARVASSTPTTDVNSQTRKT